MFCVFLGGGVFAPWVCLTMLLAAGVDLAVDPFVCYGKSDPTLISSITWLHSNQDQKRLVKIEEYTDFFMWGAGPDYYGPRN